MTVVTRFAPSPTGFLHIGGARTALFNWLFARHHGGEMKLRIEDTDRKRSTQPAIDAILDGLTWLGLDWDGDAVFQFARMARHAEVVEEMLARGHAYKCYATAEDLAEMRAAAEAKGERFRYDGMWRDRDPADAPAGVKPAIRLKAPRTGETVIEDKVQGRVTVANAELDDMVLLRADGTPTYMLAVVVDDHDMGVTHVIRGDDHLNNAFRQAQVFAAMGWDLPVFAHIPLIHGADGAKLSKRHGALGVEAYRDMGFLPEAIRNYLLRLGWSHGDLELVSTEEAIRLFDLDGVNRAPARFDMTKLESVNAHYMREAAPETLLKETISRIEEDIDRKLENKELDRINMGIQSLIARAKTLIDLKNGAMIYVNINNRPTTEKADAILENAFTVDALSTANNKIESMTVESWSDEKNIENAIREAATEKGLKLGNVAQPLRAAITGSDASPGLFEVMRILGQEETLRRSKEALRKRQSC